MRRPEFTDMMEAARVSSFMEPASVGRWKIKGFRIDEREYMAQIGRAIADGGPTREQRLQRTVPPGDYIMLGRKATEQEIADLVSGEIVDGGFPDEDFHVPIMSDTPAEIGEHAHALENATGRVLITGLGLGVIVSALLTKPDVEHITVVEIDRDVIALTGPYYEDNDRVTIVNQDALTFARNRPTNTGWVHPDRRFDYAWHDIWSHISDRNLDDDALAEHGISYRTMFEAYAPFVSEQSAWAWPEAKEMRDLKRVETEVNEAWARRFIDADHETRVRMLVEFKCRQSLGLPQNAVVPPDVYAFFCEHTGGEEAARQIIAERPIVEDFKRILTENEPDDPMARPNEVPEANVAR